MTRKTSPFIYLIVLIFWQIAVAGEPLNLANRPPLKSKPYVELPLGAIRPQGWLLHQLQTMAEGLTGHLDERYEKVVGSRNGWIGGDGDGWERGPYWIDGLLPLAYILNDQRLIEKTKPWIEWALNSQQPDGYFGPQELENPTPEPGLQKTMRRDWWPKMVMLKALMQYHSATGDGRVIELMRNYFSYQLKQLPKTPLDHWTIWANRRGGDNLMAVYWLYNHTGEKFLLKLADLLYEQTFPWTRVFLNDRPKNLYQVFPNAEPWIYADIRYPWQDAQIDALSLKDLRTFHCVNIAQGIKQPIVYYQQHPQEKYLTAVHNALEDLRRYHGQPQGMFGGDEPLHGPAPTQGIELCSVVEMMFSLETMLAITGDVSFADLLEKIAYNALPTQVTDDFNYRQYFQCANQVLISRERRNFYETEHHGHTDNCFGLLTGYPCCTCNMHQGWPKFTHNLWYATPEGGLAAVVYAPSQVQARVADGTIISFTEETDYPFGENIRFIFHAAKAVAFPLSLRIPGWCAEAKVIVNGTLQGQYRGGQIIRLQRRWQDKDIVELTLPMSVAISRWYDGAAAVERGPLVFSLRIGEDWQWVDSEDKWGSYWEVHPTDPWNYGLLEAAVKDPQQGFKVVFQDKVSVTPWNLQNAPVHIQTKGKLIAEWQLYQNSAGPLPWSPVTNLQDQSPVELTLVPYGCSTLRITEFPVVR